MKASCVPPNYNKLSRDAMKNEIEEINHIINQIWKVFVQCNYILFSLPLKVCPERAPPQYPTITTLLVLSIATLYPKSPPEVPN